MSNNNHELKDSAIPERGVTKVDAAKEPPAPKRVMSFHAHPDDQEFTVGGTIAKWTRAGSEIISVIVTSGDSGSHLKTDPKMTKQELVQIREEEQRNANRVLGVKETIFLRRLDGMLTPSIEMRRDLTRLIRKYKPDAVICGDPTVRFYGNSYMNHPDHRVAADVALDAVFPSAGTRLIFPELLEEGLEPHEVKRVFIHGADKPDTFIDITDTIEIKIAALQEHKSQVGHWDVAKRMREWAEEGGKVHGVKYAEAYRLMILVDEKQEETESEHTEMKK
jgi:LmbE family N-acetylglucosaminyl deacetylase